MSRLSENKQNKVTYISLSLLLILINAVVLTFFLPKTSSFSTKAEAEAVKPSTIASSEEGSAAFVLSLIANVKNNQSSVPETTSLVSETSGETQVAKAETQVNTETYPSTAYTQTNYQAPTAAPSAAPTTHLTNGNTAGQVGKEAAAQMAAATGVPQSTWESIIARESNGNPNAANASGASGLFQTMPNWGSTATVQDQVNAAIKAYNAQGLSAWRY